MKHYQRNRSETLSLRLTAKEKTLLKSLAAKNGMSITDYILLSALQYSAAGRHAPALKLLYEANVLSDTAIVCAEWEKDSLFEEEPSLSSLYDVSKVYKSGRIYFYKLTPKSKETDPEG